MAETSINAVPYPPRDWEIRRVEDFHTYSMENVTDPLEGELLLTVDRSGNVRGNFRFALDGKAMLSVDHLASELLLTGGAASFKLQWQTWPRDIQLRQNSMTSPWIDLAER
jgi:hypothetical protein